MITSSDLMALAERLSATGTEVDGRSAVSRAYYSAFHLAKRLIEDVCGVTLPKGPECHQKLHMCMDSPKHAKLNELAGRLRSLREERNAADYRLTDPKFAKQNNVVMQVGIAKAIAGELTALASDPKQYKQAVREYAGNNLKLQLKPS